MAQAQGLERLAEAGGGMGRRPLQRLGQVVPAYGPGRFGVAAGQFQHRVDGLHRGVQEGLGFPVAGQPGPGGLSRRAPGDEALAQDHAPVGADVADGPELVEGAPGQEPVHFLGRVQGRNPPHRPGEHDALIRLDHHGLGLAQAAGQPGRPPGPVQTLALAFGQDVHRVGGAEAVVLTGPDAPFHLRQPGREFRQGLLPMFQHGVHRTLASTSSS
ncbi:MAG: hypothetical protein WAU78_02515 [Roseiarcus sp.]